MIGLGLGPVDRVRVRVRVRSLKGPDVRVTTQCNAGCTGATLSIQNG